MKKNKGFTLIELLVVIAIIGILSSVVLASLNSARQKSRDAKRISDIKQMQVALELYFDSNGYYPQNIAAVVTAGFLPASPADPLNTGIYTYKYATLSATPASNLDYHMATVLEGIVGKGVLETDSDCSSAAAGCFTGAAAANGFLGLSTDCATTAAASNAVETCYDVTP